MGTIKSKVGQVAPKVRTSSKANRERDTRLTYDFFGESSVYIAPRLTAAGDLIIDCKDTRAALSKRPSKPKFEYQLTVKKDYKDQLLIALLDKNYGGGRTPIAELIDLLKRTNGVSFEWSGELAAESSSL
ncbi:MAG: hypothetical protein JNJ55_03820 [Betaproteobacteria bacterium]|nr:hypothetical protein [Betaproteobacteria bacterium]